MKCTAPHSIMCANAFEPAALTGGASVVLPRCVGGGAWNTGSWIPRKVHCSSQCVVTILKLKIVFLSLKDPTTKAVYRSTIQPTCFEVALLNEDKTQARIWEGQSMTAVWVKVLM